VIKTLFFHQLIKLFKLFSASSLMKFFSNATSWMNLSSLSSSSFHALHGFGMILSTTNKTYYVVDYLGHKIFTLNDNWVYISSITNFSAPTCMMVVNDTIYISGNANVWKTDSNLNIIHQYNDTGVPLNRGIYVDSVYSFVYVSAYIFKRIDIFDLDLNLNDSILISVNPWTITKYNNQLFVGTLNGTILTIVNKTIINSINGCNGNSAGITSIVFDECAYMATSCDSPVNQVFLYYSNGSFIDKSISTPYRPFVIGFDSKNRFYILSMNQISLFN
jgi:hypothetical protein